VPGRLSLLDGRRPEGARRQVEVARWGPRCARRVKRRIAFISGAG
jgi:hypothetical protein